MPKKDCARASDMSHRGVPPYSCRHKEVGRGPVTEDRITVDAEIDDAAVVFRRKASAEGAIGEDEDGGDDESARPDSPGEANRLDLGAELDGQDDAAYVPLSAEQIASR